MEKQSSHLIAQIPFRNKWIFEFVVNEHSRVLLSSRWKSAESFSRTSFKKNPTWMTHDWIDPVKKYLETGCPLGVSTFSLALDQASQFLEIAALTEFQKKIYQQLARLPAGHTLSYADLAAAVGMRGAARAVGSAMRKNPWPLFIPCHRVLRSDGSIGFYTAPRGEALKVELLKLEGIKI